MAPIDPRTSALLVIDMQNGFCDAEGAMTRAGIDMSAQRAVVPNVCTLVQACRRLGLPVIWTLNEDLPEDVTEARRRIPSHLAKRSILPTARGTRDAELVAPLAALVEPRDHRITKHRMSCFYSTTLESVLHMLGTRHLIVCGVSTSVCVESTIRDAYFRDLDVTVVEDCVAGSFADLHAATLKNVRIYFGEVVSLAAFLDARRAGVPVS